MDDDDFDLDDDDDDGRPFTWGRFALALVTTTLAAVLTHYLFGVP